MVRVWSSVAILSWAATAVLCESRTKMVIGYFPNWLYGNYPVEKISYDQYTHINYAFAILNDPSHEPSFTDKEAVDMYLPKLVAQAHAAKTKVLLSVGGWTGSKEFSPMAASPDSRKRFIDWNVDFIEKYNTDGVDIDWEYPGKQAAGCNAFTDVDADNFLVLLKELRTALDAKYPETHKEISMAVHVLPFVKYGKPMTDVSAFVPYFDHINLMAYDINGAWAPVTGPNAPFQAEVGKGDQFSFVDSIKAWKAAGVPGEKMTAGLAFYGRSMTAEVDMTKADSQYQPAKVGAPKGDSDDAYWADPYCPADIAGTSGVWKWTNLRSEKVLLEDRVTPGPGWHRYWDEITKTPWLFNPETKQFISYDDPRSLEIKVNHALCEDLAGVMVWDIHQDNSELAQVANMIHNSKPATCPLSEAQGTLAPAPSSASASVPAASSAPASSSLPSASSQASSYSLPMSISVSQHSASSSSASHSESFDGMSSVSLPTSSASPSAVASATPSSTLAKDTSCSTPGEQKCLDNGVSPVWLTCNFGTWLERNCSPGLACIETQNSLYCGQQMNVEADPNPSEVVAIKTLPLASLAVERPVKAEPM